MKKFTTTYIRPSESTPWPWKVPAYAESFPVDISAYAKESYPDVIVDQTMSAVSINELVFTATFADTTGPIASDATINGALAFIDAYCTEHGITVIKSEQDI